MGDSEQETELGALAEEEEAKAMERYDKDYLRKKDVDAAGKQPREVERPVLLLQQNEPNFGDPPFLMQLDPESTVLFSDATLCSDGPKSASQKVELTNTTDVRQLFKVKCTSNKLFRIKPLMGFIEIDATISIRVSFSGATLPEDGRHYFSFYHKKFEEVGV